MVANNISIFFSERVLKVSRAVRVQGARSAETGVYWTYMRISSTAQRRNRASKQLLKHVLRNLLESASANDLIRAGNIAQRNAPHMHQTTEWKNQENRHTQKQV